MQTDIPRLNFLFTRTNKRIYAEQLEITSSYCRANRNETNDEAKIENHTKSDEDTESGSDSEHSHKKRKDSLEGSLDRVSFAAELEFLKILVPRLPQHTSNVNIGCARKSESGMVKTTIFFIYDLFLGALIHLSFIILMLICF